VNFNTALSVAKFAPNAGEEALRLYRRMSLAKGCAPDGFTMTALVGACCPSHVDAAADVYQRYLQAGGTANLINLTALIEACSFVRTPLFPSPLAPNPGLLC